MVDNKDNDLLDLDEEDYDTVLAPDIDFTGTIQFAEPLMNFGQAGAPSCVAPSAPLVVCFLRPSSPID